MQSAPPPLGRGILIVLRIVAVLASLTFAFLLGSTILLAVPPNLEVGLPNFEGTTFTYANGVLQVDTSLLLTNNGYFLGGYPITPDLTNVSLSVTTRVEDIEVGSVTSPPVDIPVGTTAALPLSAAIALAPLQSTSYLVFQPANITFSVGGGVTTARGFLDVAASVTFRQAFDPLFSDITVDPSNTTFTNVTGGVEWGLPYSLVTADFLPGNASGTFTILNQTGGFVSNATEIFPLGGPVSGNLTLFLTNDSFLELQAGPQDLTVEFSLQLPGNLLFSYSLVVPWDPSGGG